MDCVDPAPYRSKGHGACHVPPTPREVSERVFKRILKQKTNVLPARYPSLAPLLCLHSQQTDSLTVIDNRTNKVYEIPIADNSIPATAFKKMSLKGIGRMEDESGNGLR